MDTLTSIKVFRQAIDCGGFARAADRLEMATAMVSKHIMSVDLEYARLSLIAQRVADYIQLRSLDRAGAILDQAVKDYRRALLITEKPHNAGIAPGLDVSQAQMQPDAARSQAQQTLAERALMEHAIAALLGMSDRLSDRRHVADRAAADSARSARSRYHAALRQRRSHPGTGWRLGARRRLAGARHGGSAGKLIWKFLSEVRRRFGE
jgi:outer membrane protein TolC